MSLIRPGSNPEGMYVFGGCGQPMEITSGRDWHLSNVGPDNGPNATMIVPAKTFYRVCKKADGVAYGGTPVQINGFRVEEQTVFFKSGRKASDGAVTKNFFSKNPVQIESLIKLSYKNHYVFMYAVTWEYIRRNAVEQAAWEHEALRQASL